MELRRSSNHDGFKSNSERDIGSVFQIDVANNQSELMRSLDKIWKACYTVQIIVETLFVLYIQDTEYLVRCPFCVLQGFFYVLHNTHLQRYQDKTN